MNVKKYVYGSSIGTLENVIDEMMLEGKEITSISVTKYSKNGYSLLAVAAYIFYND